MTGTTIQNFSRDPPFYFDTGQMIAATFHQAGYPLERRRKAAGLLL